MSQLNSATYRKETITHEQVKLICGKQGGFNTEKSDGEDDHTNWLKEEKKDLSP